MLRGKLEFAPRKAGVCSEESGGFLGGKSDFARRKVRWA